MILSATLTTLRIDLDTDRQWPWVQSGFFTLHALVMLMKMHSYLAVNGYLSRVNQIHIETVKKLNAACDALGGYEKALLQAREAKREMMANDTSSTPPVSSVNKNHLDSNDVASIAIHNAANEAGLRNRLHSIPSTASATPTTSDASYFPPGSPVQSDSTHPLIDHPDKTVATLAQDITDMETELTSTGKKQIRFPENVTFWNFVDYQMVPTLVYELEYPRTNRYVHFRSILTASLLLTLLAQNTAHVSSREDSSYPRNVYSALYCRRTVYYSLDAPPGSILLPLIAGSCTSLHGSSLTFHHLDLADQTSDRSLLARIFASLLYHLW